MPILPDNRLFFSDAVEARSSVAVQGRYTEEAALHLLLEGTGLVAEQRNSDLGRTFVLRQAGPDSAAVAPPVALVLARCRHEFLIGDGIDVGVPAKDADLGGDILQGGQEFGAGVMPVEALFIGPPFQNMEEALVADVLRKRVEQGAPIGIGLLDVRDEDVLESLTVIGVDLEGADDDEADIGSGSEHDGGIVLSS